MTELSYEQVIVEGRRQAAEEILRFVEACEVRAAQHAPELSDCARRANTAVIEAYRKAASIARDGSPRNTHCANCGDTRGGPLGHETSECTWRRPAGLYEGSQDDLGGRIDLARAASGSPLRAQAPEPERCEHCGGGLVLLAPKDTVKICCDCGVAAIRRRADRPVDLWLGPPRRDTVRLADIDLHNQGQA